MVKKGFVEEVVFEQGLFLFLSHLLLKNFNWRRVPLHCCVGFCCTPAWIGWSTRVSPPCASLLPRLRASRLSAAAGR